MTLDTPVSEVLYSHEMPAKALDPDLKKARDAKVQIATISLCGCWGCNLSLLDTDEALVDLLDKVHITRSSFTDIKRIPGRIAVGLIEGGVANDENIETLEHFREHCDILIATGACAIWGGVPSMRNMVGLEPCLREAYVDSPTRPTQSPPVVPCHPDIPKLTRKVYPVHEVVKIDVSIPGCPPDGRTIFKVIDDLLNGRGFSMPAEYNRFD